MHLRWYNSACLNALAYSYLCIARRSDKQREVCVAKMFSLLFKELGEVKHKELREVVSALIDRDIGDDVVWPWTENYGKFSNRSFKVYLILGTSRNFIRLHGSCLYVGFSFQLGMGRIVGNGYINEDLVDLLHGSFVCCCVCAIDIDAVAKDFDRYRKAIYRVEEIVYSWFDLQGQKLLNQTLHIDNCGCWSCVSVTI